MAWALARCHSSSRCLKQQMQQCSTTVPAQFAQLGPSKHLSNRRILLLNSWHVRSSANGQLPARRLSAASPARQFLQAVELAAISVAAACQAAMLVNAAVQYSRAQLQPPSHQQAGFVATSSLANDELLFQEQQQQQQQQQHVLVQPSSSSLQAAVAAHSGQLQGAALLVALMCGVALRYLQKPRLPTGTPSADAAARLVALEVAVQQQAAQLTTAARQLDKLQARVRVATSDLKTPLRAAQGTASQAAAALAQLAEQQQKQQQQLDGGTELIAALHGLAAKQFKVSSDALQQLKQGQAQLSNNTNKSLSELTEQQRQLQHVLQQQRQQMQALELQCWQMQQHHWANSSGGSGNNGSSVGSSGIDVSLHHEAPPDPWGKAASNGAAASSNGMK